VVGRIAPLPLEGFFASVDSFDRHVVMAVNDENSVVNCLGLFQADTGLFHARLLRRSGRHPGCKDSGYAATGGSLQKVTSCFHAASVFDRPGRGKLTTTCFPERAGAAQFKAGSQAL
jgi:hypothetical protein